MTLVLCSHSDCYKPAVGGDRHMSLCPRHWRLLQEVREQIEADEYETDEKLNRAVLRAAFDAGKRE